MTISNSFTQLSYVISVNQEVIIDLNKFTSNRDSQLCPFIFTYQNAADSAQSVRTDIFKFSNYNKILTVTPLQMDQLGNYQIKIIASVVGYKSDSITLSIVINFQCQYDILSSKGPQQLVYTINDPAEYVEFDVQQVTSQFSCPLTFACADHNTSTCVNDLYLFDQDQNKIMVQTSDIELAQIYDLVITVINQGGLQTSYTLKINAVNTCSNTQISSSNLLDVTYDVNSYQQKILQTLTWTQTLYRICPALTYAATFVDSSPSIFDLSEFQWDSSSNSIKILTDENFPVGIYNIKVTANVYQSAQSQTFKLTVTDNCLQGALQKSSLQSQYTYQLASQRLDISYNEWEVQSSLINLCGQPKYQLVKQITGLEITDTSVFTFAQTERVIKVYTTDTNKIGIYNLQLKGFLQPHSQIKSLQFINFEVAIIQQSFPFLEQLTDSYKDCSEARIKTTPTLIEITYLIGAFKAQQTSYTLLSWTSTDSHCKFSNYKASYESSYLPIAGVIDFSEDNMLFEVDSESLESYPKIGTFPIKVQASLPNGLTYSYSFNLKISQNSTYQEQKTEEKTTSETVKYQQTIFNENMDTVTISNLKVKKAELNPTMTAKISGVSMTGILTCKFSEYLTNVPDLTLIKFSKALKFQYIQYDQITEQESKSSMSNYSSGLKDWEVIKLQDNEMQIKLYWYDAKQISLEKVIQTSHINLLQNYDLIKMTFLYPYFFVNKPLNQVIKTFTTISSEVPPQLEGNQLSIPHQILEGSFLASSTETAVNALTGVVSLNFFLSLFMGLSLKNLWMLLNTLQFMVNIPLLQIALPSNALYLFQTTKDIAELNFIPKKLIKEYVLDIFGSASSSLDSRYSNMDIFSFTALINISLTLQRYQSDSLLDNMGQVFLVTIIVAIFSLFLLITLKLSKKVKKQVFKQNQFFFRVQMILLKIKQSIFYNTFLRSLLKGYLTYCLAIFISLSSSLEQGNIANSIPSMLFATLIIAIPAVISIFLIQKFHRLEEENFVKKFGTLYLNLKIAQKIDVQFTTLFLFRRTIFALTIVFMSDSPVFQMMTSILQSFMMLGFIFYVQSQTPFKFLFLEAFNEFSILGVSYMLIPFSMNSISDTTLRYNLGWYIVGLTGINIALNWLNLLLTCLMSMAAKLSSFLKKRKQLKQKKYMMESSSATLHKLSTLVKEQNPQDQEISYNFEAPSISNNQKPQRSQWSQQKKNLHFALTSDQLVTIDKSLSGSFYNDRSYVEFEPHSAIHLNPLDNVNEESELDLDTQRESRVMDSTFTTLKSFYSPKKSFNQLQSPTFRKVQAYPNLIQSRTFNLDNNLLRVEEFEDGLTNEVQAYHLGKSNIGKFEIQKIERVEEIEEINLDHFDERQDFEMNEQEQHHNELENCQSSLIQEEIEDIAQQYDQEIGNAALDDIGEVFGHFIPNNFEKDEGSNQDFAYWIDQKNQNNQVQDIESQNENSLQIEDL